MKLYGISGLGADERTFKALNIHLENKISIIPWEVPKRNETLEEYASRLSEEIDSSKNFILIGVSFGGMVATEISKLKRPIKIILISSAASKEELPYSLMLFKSLGLHHLPSALLRPPEFLLTWAFSVKEENKQLLLDIIRKTDIRFLKWAIGTIVNWKNKEIPDNLIRIHGQQDRIIPMSNYLNCHIIPDTGHFMIVDKASEVATVINDELKKDVIRDL